MWRGESENSVFSQGWNPRWRGKKTLKNKIKNKKKKLGKNGIFRFFSPHHVR
jgi:hypothetical protein